MSIIAIERLEWSPGDQLGQARVRGSIVTVHDIVLEHRDDHLSAEEIASMFDIDISDVYAALAYYYDNKARLDQELAENEAAYQAKRLQYPSLFQEKLSRLGLKVDLVSRMKMFSALLRLEIKRLWRKSGVENGRRHERGSFSPR
jgi:uncharacterized protein (DUF433 family)